MSQHYLVTINSSYVVSYGKKKWATGPDGPFLHRTVKDTSIAANSSNTCIVIAHMCIYQVSCN